MTHDQAKQRVQHIRDIANDPEAAHGAEDQLFLDFVRHVASFEGPHRAIAEEILKSGEIDFPRYCA